MVRWHEHTVSVVMTVKNDSVGCAVTLNSLTQQTRPPDEIVVVDGGSTDDTVRVIRQYAGVLPQLKLIEAPEANIARGRNLGVEAAGGEIVMTTDAGCRAEPQWIERLLAPFREDAATEFVAGFYRVEPHTFFERVAGLATMRGQLDPVSPETFNPSARSLALTKSLWERAGGWPEWIDYSEDTLFDHRVRNMNVGWRFAGDAIIHWRPRGSFPSLARQFYNYGTGRGHTQIGAAGYTYNVRNLAIIVIACVLALVTPWFLLLVLPSIAYFCVWAHHRLAASITRRTGRRTAYPLCVAIMNVVVAAGTCGFLVGSWQRRRDSRRYRRRTDAYLAQPGWAGRRDHALGQSAAGTRHRFA